MPKRIFSLVLLVLALCAVSCGDDTVTKPGNGAYLEPTSPENVVANLITAYERKEIDTYAKLLAPEFEFNFQPQDLALIEDDFWTKTQDVAGTTGLFATPLVGDIRINLTHGPAQAPQESGFETGVMMIRINPTQLEVDIIGGDNAGTTFRIDGDIQDMFFRPGKAELGENPDHWFLIEWRDIPSPIAVPGSRMDPGTQAAAIAAVTWGRIKMLFT